MTERDYRQQFLLAIEALSWAVGHIEGLGHGTDNYASRALERLKEPAVAASIAAAAEARASQGTQQTGGTE